MIKISGIDYVLNFGTIIGFLGFFCCIILYFIDFYDRKIDDYFAVSDRASISKIFGGIFKYPKVILTLNLFYYLIILFLYIKILFNISYFIFGD